MYLLDTNALIGYLFTKNIPAKAKDAIAETKEVYVSIASLWEIAIKQSIGKIEIKDSLTAVSKACEELEFDILPIKPIHLDRIKGLPLHHNDPFDRLIIAQAMEEGMVIISSDTIIPKYPVTVIWK